MVTHIPGYIFSDEAPGKVVLRLEFLDSFFGGDALFGTYKGFFCLQAACLSLITVTYGRKLLVNNEARLLKCI